LKGVSIPLLGIDVGTGGTRALILSEQGQILGSASEEHVPFASPQIGWAEQDPADWWRASTIAIRKALANANLRGNDIACIGFSGQMGKYTEIYIKFTDNRISDDFFVLSLTCQSIH